jgi:hypothetical protein
VLHLWTGATDLVPDYILSDGQLIYLREDFVRILLQETPDFRNPNEHWCFGHSSVSSTFDDWLRVLAAGKQINIFQHDKVKRK